jgi:mono/diheme cytochrome c family protein
MRTSTRVVALSCIPLFALSHVGKAQTQNISYKAKCEVCHGSTGLADTPTAKRMMVLPFTDPTIVAKSDSDIIGMIENGSGKMPAYKGKLTDQEINGYIQFMRQVQDKQH